MPRLNLQPIRFRSPGLHPGGFTFVPALGGFLVCSQRLGKLVLVSMDGTCVDLLDHADLVTSTAVRVRDGRAYVTVGHRGVGGRSLSPQKSPGDETILRLGRVCIFDLASRRHLRTLDLGPVISGSHALLPDDLVVADDGSIYVTDACRPVIYRVPPAGRGEPHIFLDDERLGGSDGTSGSVGGITLTGDGFLLLSTAGDGMLFKAPLSAPHEFRAVGIPHGFPGADAIVSAPDGYLYLAADAPAPGDRGAVWRLAPEEGFERVRVVDVHPCGPVGRPVALAAVGRRVWGIEGRLDSVEDAATADSEWMIAPCVTDPS